MQVEITLPQDNDGNHIVINNSDDESMIFITNRKSNMELCAKVSIEELKHALRKFSVK